jgi:multiple sugar transport system substrate-binding protein
MRWILALAVSLAVVAALWPSEAGSPEEKAALEEGRIVITYWDRHTGHEFDERKVLIDEFNASQSEVYVRALPIGFTMEKLLTSIAAGTPPDILSTEGTILDALAPQHCVMPLDTFIEKSESIEPDDFFPHLWRAVTFDGHTWGIPVTTDSICLLWNKAAFRRAGLDPERPPKTMEELLEYASKLTVRDGAGLKQIGFLPWLPWDHTHMWGGLFGGQWFDDVSGRFVCGDDPQILAMFRWMQSFSIDPAAPAQLPYALNPEMVAAFQTGFGAYQSANNPFYSGKVAMTQEGEWQTSFIKRYAPELDWGVAPLPQPEGAPPRCYSPTCVLDLIPAGAPHPEAAWKYIEWFNSPRPGGQPSPASDYNHAICNIPCRRADAMHERVLGDPAMSVFVNELLTKEPLVYPVTPVAQFFIDQVERERGLVILRQRTPEQAARAIEDSANAELDRILTIMRHERP